MALSRNHQQYSHSLGNSIQTTGRHGVTGASRSQSQQELAEIKQYIKIEANLLPSTKAITGSRMRGGHSQKQLKDNSVYDKVSLPHINIEREVQKQRLTDAVRGKIEDPYGSAEQRKIPLKANYRSESMAGKSNLLSKFVDNVGPKPGHQKQNSLIKVHSDLNLDQSISMPTGGRDIPLKQQQISKARSVARFSDHPGQIKGRRGIDPVVQSDIVTFQQQVNHAQAGPGPASYLLPSLISQKQTISTMRTSPSITLAQNLKKKPYFHENFKDFIGLDSPPLNKYSPSHRQTINKEPQFSQAKFQRFHKPSSVVRVEEQVPVQYSTVDFGEQLKKGQHVHMMGMAKKYSFEPKALPQPGPGTYSGAHNTISLTASKTLQKGTSPLAFGSSVAQNDKLQYHGQQRHFLGRQGALGPGGYDPDVRYDSPKKANYTRLTSLSRKGMAPPKDDRGLAPTSEVLQRKEKTYNMSHAQVGPASYNADRWNTIGARYGKK